MKAALDVEIRKLIQRPALWWSVFAGVVMTALFGYVIPYSIGQGAGGPQGNGQGYTVAVEQLFPASFVDTAISGFPLFYFAIAVVLGALVAGGEYRWGTVRTMLIRGPGRIAFLSSTLIALIVLVLPIVLASFAAAAISAVVVAALEGGAMAWPGIAEIATGIGAAWLILAVGAVLGVLGGVLVRDTGPVIGGALVYVFIVEQFVAGFARDSEPVEAVATALPGINAGSLAGALADATATGGAPGVNALFAGGQAVVALGAWLIVGVLAALVIFDRRDVTA